MSATMAEQTIYTVDEVAAILRVHRTTVTKLIAQGKLEAFNVGREYRIRQEALEQFMRSRDGSKEQQKGE